MNTLLKTATLGLLAFSVSISTSFGQSKDELMKKGEKVYKEYCQTCHQATGAGLPNVYPPLAKSDYLKKDKKHLIQSVIWGLSGEIVVNGKKFNGVMAPLPAKYKDDEIAAVITYAFNSFGNSAGVVTPAEVTKIKKEGNKPQKAMK